MKDAILIAGLLMPFLVAFVLARLNRQRADREARKFAQREIAEHRAIWSKESPLAIRIRERLEQDKEVTLAFLPFFHIYGQVVIMLHGLCRGQLLVLFTNPDTEAMLAAIKAAGELVAPSPEETLVHLGLDLPVGTEVAQTQDAAGLDQPDHARSIRSDLRPDRPGLVRQTQLLGLGVNGEARAAGDKGVPLRHERPFIARLDRGRPVRVPVHPRRPAPR